MDLLEITYATYDERQNGNLRAALGPVFRNILQRIKELPKIRVSEETRLYTLIGLYNEPPLEVANPYLQIFRRYERTQCEPYSKPVGRPSTREFCKGHALSRSATGILCKDCF